MILCCIIKIDMKEKLRKGISKLPDLIDEFMAFIDHAFVNDKINVYGAQAAFYFIVSAVPFLMFLLSTLRYIIPITMDELLEALNMLPSSIAYWIASIVSQIYTESSVPLLSITAITTLYAASKSVHALSIALMQIYEPDKVYRTIKNWMISLIDTLLMILVIGGSLVLLVFGKPIVKLIISCLPSELDFIFDLLRSTKIITYRVIVLIFALLYKVLSNTKRPYREQLPGAVFAMVGWSIFSGIYAFYINNYSNFSVTYGSLAAVVLLMLWLNVCLNIFLWGGEINVFLDKKRKEKDSHV